MTGGRLRDQVVVVTGAAGGMGSTDIRALVAEGARVIAGDVDTEAGHRLEAHYDGGVRFVELDVIDEDAWSRAITIAESEFGPVTGLINNAGIVAWGDVASMMEEDFRRVLDVNVVGTFLGMKSVAPSLRRAGGGTIVNISSIGGMVGGSSSIAYTASKWAIRGMSKGAALQLAAEGIRVHSVHPGLIDTPMGRAAGERTVLPPLQRYGTAEDVAGLIVFLLSDDASYMTGTEQVIDGGTLAGSLHMELALGTRSSIARTALREQ